MNPEDFHDFCLAFARDLNDRFGEGLPEHVEVALAGLAAPLHGGRMTDIAGLVSATADVGEVVVGLLSAAFAYLAIPKRDRAGKTRLKPIDAKTLPKLNKALDEAIADLGSQHRDVGKRLQAEIVDWLRKRGED